MQQEKERKPQPIETDRGEQAPQPRESPKQASSLDNASAPPIDADEIDDAGWLCI